MGRKLIGLTVGFLLTTVLSYALFPLPYESLIRWLAPYLGPWLRFFFMYLFIYFGHPIAFPTVAIIWVVVGIIAGLFIRSIWGAIPVVIMIFFLTFLMIIVGLAAVFLPLLLTGGFGGIDFMAMLSAIPPDVSMFDILNAPVMGPIINAIMGGIGDVVGGGMTDPTMILTLIQSVLVNTIIIPAILNFIICVVTAMIGGFIGRAIFRPES